MENNFINLNGKISDYAPRIFTESKTTNTRLIDLQRHLNVLLNEYKQLNATADNCKKVWEGIQQIFRQYKDAWDGNDPAYNEIVEKIREIGKNIAYNSPTKVASQSQFAKYVKSKEDFNRQIGYLKYSIMFARDRKELFALFDEYTKLSFMYTDFYPQNDRTDDNNFEYLNILSIEYDNDKYERINDIRKIFYASAKWVGNNKDKSEIAYDIIYGDTSYSIAI